MINKYNIKTKFKKSKFKKTTEKNKNIIKTSKTKKKQNKNKSTNNVKPSMLVKIPSIYNSNERITVKDILSKKTTSSQTSLSLTNLKKPYNPIPKNYYKYNKYQLIDNTYKGGIIKHTYKQPLTKLTIKSIQSTIFNNYIKNNDYNYITDDIIEINLHNTISNKLINRIINLILKYGGIDFKVFDYNITKICCIPYEESYTLQSIDKKSLHGNTAIKTAIIQALNKLISSINLVLGMYNKLTIYHKPSKDFYEIVEHLCFNASFDYLKQEGLLAKINSAYKNQFNEKRETLFTNNKYIQLYYPFKISDAKDASKLMMTNVGLYSISKPQATTQIFNIIKNKLDFLGLKPENLTITDATAGLGGETLSFAHEFKTVNSVEIQEPHHKAVKNNAELFNLRNINHINADYTKVYDTLEQDIIFIDSPWGGTAYKTDAKTELRMFGSDLKFNDFIKKLLKKNVIIFLKTPSNIDFTKLKKELTQINKKLSVNADNVDNYLIISIL
jgi:16S rRNA G966 N2-methylase RsmD